MQRWIGRLALVTCTSGIGASICGALVLHGINVIGCARSVEMIEGLALGLSSGKSGGNIYAMRCDLSRESEILSMFKKISNSHGRIDICINSASLNLARTTLLDGLTKKWRRAYVIANFPRRNKCHDANFFCGTKSMLTTLSRGLRLEVKPNIRVSNISPGLVQPFFVETCWGSETANNVYKGNKYLTPFDIAEAVVYILASPPHVEIPELLVRAVERTS